MERERRREGKEIRPLWCASDKNLHSKKGLYPFCERRDRETVDRAEMRVLTTGVLRDGETQGWEGTHAGWVEPADHPGLPRQLPAPRSLRPRRSLSRPEEPVTEMQDGLHPFV